jgi:hypothetical protein
MLTYRELEDWVDARLAKAAEDKEKEFQQILRDFAKYKTSDNDTLEAALRRKAQVEQPQMI